MGAVKFRPLHDRILVKPVERVKSRILAVVMDEKPNIGEVVAVGAGKPDSRGQVRPLDVKVGDCVRFGTAENYLTYPVVELNGERFLVMQEADVCWVRDAA